MKRRRLILVTGVVVSLLMFTTALFASTPLGDYGYTYRIGVAPAPTSIYNVFGQVHLKDLGTPGPGLGYAYFQTYASHQSGTQISNFNTLRLRGRIWWHGEAGCYPLTSGKKDWFGGSGAINGNILRLESVNWDVWPVLAVGKHKIVHPNTISVSTGNSPQWFYVQQDDGTNPSDINEWNGINPDWEYEQCEGSFAADSDD